MRARIGWSKTSSVGILDDYVRGKGVGVYQTASLEDTPVIVQSAISDGWDIANASTCTVTLPSAPTVGNTLILGVTISQGDSSTEPTIVDITGGNSTDWKSAATAYNSQVTSKRTKALLFYKNNIQTTTASVTITRDAYGGNPLGRVFLMEVSGLKLDTQASPIVDKSATGTGSAVYDLGSNQATVSTYLGGSPYGVNTATTAATSQGVTFGVCLAAVHNSNVGTSTSTSLIFNAPNYPDFAPLGGWATVKEGSFGKGGLGQNGDTVIATGGMFMAQTYLTIAAVKGDCAVTNSDATTSNQTAAIAMAAFKADNSVVTRVSRRYLIANDNGNGHSIYASSGSNPGSETYDLLGLVPSTGSQDQVAFATGLGVTMMTCARWTVSGHEGPRVWNGSGSLTRPITSAVVNSPDDFIAGRCIAFHKSRFFIAGTKAHPTRLWFSDVGSYTTFGADSYIEVGEEDGEPIEDIAVFENALIIGKQSSLWVLTGSGIDSFVLTRLSTGGAAPGRSICPTPYGAVVAGRDSVYLVGPESVTTISDAISDSYGLTGSHMATVYADSVTYLTDPGSGKTWALDMKTGSWWVESLSSSGHSPAAYLYNNGRIIGAPNDVSKASSGLMVWRLAPGGARSRDYSPLTGTYEVTTPEMWLSGPSAKFTPRHLFLTIRQRGGDPTQTGITVTVYYDGEEQDPIYIQPMESAGTFRKRLDIGAGQSVSSVKFKFSHTVPSDEDVLFDIEQVALDAMVERVR